MHLREENHDRTGSANRKKWIILLSLVIYVDIFEILYYNKKVFDHAIYERSCKYETIETHPFGSSESAHGR